jgi:hypothetical protein
VDATLGERMMDRLCHRGPDDKGCSILQAPISPVEDETS